ncbi:hypothetical protein EC968_009571 [Mortierella alpina]|nr:hypothetical protein EC968_009571 [Mortierella alpina]
MSNFDPTDPYDNGHPWQDVPSNPARPPSSNGHNHSDSHNNTNPATATGSSSAAAAHSRNLDSLNIPSAAAAVAAATATATAPSAPGPHAPVESVVSSSAPYPSTSSPIPPKQKLTHSSAYEDEPPSYEAAIVRDIPQIHDNYDHLRGPPGQRGVDIKTRIPLESTSASDYRPSSAGPSGSAAGGSRSDANQHYGAIQQQRPSFANLAQPSAPALLQGQTSEGRADDEAHARDVDRLLGPSHNSTHPHPHQGHHGHHGHDRSDMDDEEPDSHWSVVGDGKAWMALVYILVLLLPWALFCFIWTLGTLIVAAVSMIIPPLGYLVVIPVVTSWRALARVDLVVSRAMVARNVRERYRHSTAPVFVMPPEPVSAASWNTPSARHHRRRRQTKNLWHRGAKHLKATINNKHTVKSMFYLMFWKLFYALPIFLVIIVFSALTVPFMICLLPTLLILSRALINWQFRWAVVWLTEKPQPISLP